MLRLTTRPIMLQRAALMSVRALSENVTKTGTKTMINPNVEGLSDNCVKVPNTPVGPGASKEKEYKNPEYFCYHVDTFGEAEVELAKYRLPAPSNKVPFKQ